MYEGVGSRNFGTAIHELSLAYTLAQLSTKKLLIASEAMNDYNVQCDIMQ